MRISNDLTWFERAANEIADAWKDFEEDKAPECASMPIQFVAWMADIISEEYVRHCREENDE